MYELCLLNPRIFSKFIHGSALDASDYQYLDFKCSLLVPLNEDICDWDPNKA